MGFQPQRLAVLVLELSDRFYALIHAYARAGNLQLGSLSFVLGGFWLPRV